MDKIFLVKPDTIGTVNPDIYGVFAEHIGGVIYDGIYVGEDSNVENIRGFRKEIIDKLKQANIPLIRWPGGCFAEIYDWRDGIGPKEDRPTRINWWTFMDKKFEPNLVGTDEFLDFCNMCNAEPYLAGNLTTMSPLSLREWVDYCNSPENTTTLSKLRAQNGHPKPYNVKLWGIGNENWGDGGKMVGSYYINEYRRYATVVGNISPELELISCGSNEADFAWTHEIMAGLSEKEAKMDGMSYHYYCGGDDNVTDFSLEQWDSLIDRAKKMQDLIDRHYSIVKAYDKTNNAKLCIDEWGCWHSQGSGPSKGANLWEQQSTMRDAIVSALTLNIFNNNCDKIRLAAVAQIVNNLHALFLAGKENCICTPTYHVFNMYKTHQGGKAFKVICDNADLSASASIKDNKLTLTLANLNHTNDYEFSLNSIDFKLGNGKITILTADDIHAHNTFENPENVKPYETEFNAEEYKEITIPHASVMTIEAQIK